MDKVNEEPFRHDPVFQRVLADALAIQDRFSAEPVYGKTGKGKLKSAGVGGEGYVGRGLKGELAGGVRGHKLEICQRSLKLSLPSPVYLPRR